MSDRLTGKSAAITGAASGMGKAIALAYLEAGADIVASDINETRLKELAVEVAELGYAEHFVSQYCDVRNTEDCENLIRACVETFGTCNVLSHNAGIVDNFARVADVTDESWERIMNTNLTGSLKICRAALNYFVSNEIAASIIMITSNGAFESATGGPAYCASKAGANGLMKAIAFEYGRLGIRCNSICPGPVATNISESMGVPDMAGMDVHLKSGYNASGGEYMVKPIAAAEDIAPLAVYLASDESSFVNSASIIIDGGVCLSA